MVKLKIILYKLLVPDAASSVAESSKSVDIYGTTGHINFFKDIESGVRI